jgi:protein-tyrosine-phosphatase
MTPGSPLPSVLFVCTGNTCRSPMAEALLRARVQNNFRDGPSWRIASAGTGAIAGQPASPHAVEAAARLGLDLNPHRSQPVTSDLLNGFQLVLTMEASHQSMLQTRFPARAARIFLLSEMHGQRLPVPDPIGGSLDEYQRTAAQIDSWIESGLERILQLAYSPQ